MTYPDVPAPADDIAEILDRLRQIEHAVRATQAAGELTMGDVDSVHKILDTLSDALGVPDPSEDQP